MNDYASVEKNRINVVYGVWSHKAGMISTLLLQIGKKFYSYNKFKYEQQKKKRDHQKKSAAHRMDLKELKMGKRLFKGMLSDLSTHAVP
ncbi:hypothetical protein AgCh_017743 [Apium graveolens]